LHPGISQSKRGIGVYHFIEILLAENMVLFQHDYYRGLMQVLSSSYPDLADVSFDNDVTSLIITGGTWELHSDTNYQGSSVRLGKGRYPTAPSLSPIANDDLSSVRFIGKNALKQ